MNVGTAWHEMIWYGAGAILGADGDEEREREYVCGGRENERGRRAAKKWSVVHDKFHSLADQKAGNP